MDVDAAIFKIARVGVNAYLACAGDEGLYGVVNDNPSLIDVDSEGRWCFDAAVSSDGIFLYALFAGLDTSQLRVYILPPYAPEILPLSTIELSSSTPLPPTDPPIRPGTAYALALKGYDAYVANGRGGLLKVSPYVGPLGGLEWDVDQGPPSGTGPVGCPYPGDCFALSRVRDLAIVDDYLYAAGDSQGADRGGPDAALGRGHAGRDPRAGQPGRHPLLLGVARAPRPARRRDGGPERARPHRDRPGYDLPRHHLRGGRALRALRRLRLEPVALGTVPGARPVGL